MKLLILEDDRNFATLVCVALEGLFDEVQIVESWDKAEPLFSNQNVAWIDLRVSADVSVEQAVLKIKTTREQNLDLVIVVGSGFITPELRAKLERAGVDSVFYKDSGFSPQQVASIIVAALMRASMRSGEKVRTLLTKALEWHHLKYPDLIPDKA